MKHLIIKYSYINLTASIKIIIFNRILNNINQIILYFFFFEK
jgi:hypothetical protein